MPENAEQSRIRLKIESLVKEDPGSAIKNIDMIHALCTDVVDLVEMLRQMSLKIEDVDSNLREKIRKSRAGTRETAEAISKQMFEQTKILDEHLHLIKQATEEMEDKGLQILVDMDEQSQQMMKVGANIERNRKEIEENSREIQKKVDQIRENDAEIRRCRERMDEIFQAWRKRDAAILKKQIDEYEIEGVKKRRKRRRLPKLFEISFSLKRD